MSFIDKFAKIVVLVLVSLVVSLERLSMQRLNELFQLFNKNFLFAPPLTDSMVVKLLKLPVELVKLFTTSSANREASLCGQTRFEVLKYLAGTVCLASGASKNETLTAEFKTTMKF
jgi:hypothetical protein